jgi:hypothetical protein
MPEEIIVGERGAAGRIAEMPRRIPATLSEILFAYHGRRGDSLE